MRARALLLLSLLLLALALPPTAVGREVELVSEAWLRGTVIVLYGSQYGTGFWINPTHIATAAHVVNFDPTAVVTIVRGSAVSRGRVVALDRAGDVAVIRVDSPDAFGDRHVFPLARVMPDVGSTIYVIGYPHELLQVVGSLEALSERPRVLTSRLTWVANGLIELGGITDAGNSGGPVLNLFGEVVGVVSFAIRGRAGTLYFATSVENLRRLCRERGIAFIEGAAGHLQRIAENPAAVAAITAATVNVVMDVALVALGASIGALVATRLRGRRWR